VREAVVRLQAALLLAQPGTEAEVKIALRELAELVGV
jgi:hypothetical protein